jgi:hypothetical protein
VREEFEQEIMVQYRTEYMVGGTGRLPSRMIENQGASLGRLAMQDRFLIRNEAQEKPLSFVPRPIVEVIGTASRVKMNAKVRRP